MSTPPLIFKRKSKPAQRTRPSSPEPDVNDTGGNESPSTLVTKLKTKVKKARPKSRLSFGGDDDEVCFLNAQKNSMLMFGVEGEGGEVFKVKKSNLSQKLTLGKHPAYVLPPF